MTNTCMAKVKCDVFLLLKMKYLMNLLIYSTLYSDEFIDPCENKPCHSGKCIAFKDKSGFRCICDSRHNGTLCEKGSCDIQPAGNVLLIIFLNNEYRIEYQECFFYFVDPMPNLYNCMLYGILTYVPSSFFVSPYRNKVL